MRLPCVRAFLLSALLALLPLDRAAAAEAEEPAPAAERGNAAAAENSGVADTLFWAPEIIVEAGRIGRETARYNRSGFVAVIDARPYRGRMEDIPSVLSRSVGIRVKQYGGLGGYATLSVRGSSSSQVQVYMDGVPLNDAYTGMTDLSDLSLGGFDRIEVFRGFSPAAFGSSSIGGTINLVTSGEPLSEGAIGTASMNALAGAGSYGTRRYRIEAAAALRLFDIRGSVNRLQSGGDFTFYDDNATPENPHDDATVERLNNDFSRWNVTGRLGCRIPGFSTASLNYHAVVREGGVPGIGTNQSTAARFERDRRLAYIKLEPEPAASKRLHLGMTGYYSRTAERFSDPGSDIALVRKKTDNRISYYGGSIRSQLFAPVLPLSFECFFEGRKDRFHPVSHLPVTVIGPDRLRETRTLTVSGDCYLLDDRLVLTAASRHQWHENEFYDEPTFPWLPPTPEGTVRRYDRSPSFGMRIRPLPNLTIKGNWGRYTRLPTFFELFGNLGSVTGAGDLENEKGLNRDIGLIISADRFWVFNRPFLELVYLNNEVDNLILFFPNSQHTVKPRNIGSAAIEGFECSFSGILPASIAVSSNYAYLDGRDTGPIPYYNGNDLAGRPKHDASCTIALERARWSIAYDLHYISSNYLDRANQTAVPSRSIHNLTLGFGMREYGVLLLIEGHNLTNSRVSDISGYPLPGRSFYTTLRINL